MNDGTATGFFADLQAFIQRPFNSQGNLLNWALFIGLISILLWGWNHIIYSITGD